MRTISLISIALMLPLFFGLLAWNTQIMWFVFAAHAIGLVILSFNEDARAFSREHPRGAMLLELAMYGTALVTIVLALHASFGWAALTSLGYGTTWGILLRFAPPFPQDGEVIDNLPRHWREEEGQ